MSGESVGLHDCNLILADGGFVVVCKCGNRTLPHEWEYDAWIEHRRHVDKALATQEKEHGDG